MESGKIQNERDVDRMNNHLDRHDAAISREIDEFLLIVDELSELDIDMNIIFSPGDLFI